jgi:hypothetical protein
MKVKSSFDVVCMACDEICYFAWQRDKANFDRLVCKCGRTNIEIRY